jgi:transcription initiation factor TFIIIB Brf1 subunit/transcription initiation factor TFIIB
MMIWLKGCPKCRGDMHYDPLVEEYVCLQCGLAIERLPSHSQPEGASPEPLAASASPAEATRPDQTSP